MTEMFMRDLGKRIGPGMADKSYKILWYGLDVAHKPANLWIKNLDAPEITTGLPTLIRTDSKVVRMSIPHNMLEEMAQMDEGQFYDIVKKGESVAERIEKNGNGLDKILDTQDLHEIVKSHVSPWHENLTKRFRKILNSL